VEVRLRFFAALRERAGNAEIARRVPPGTTIGQLWNLIVREHPALAEYRGAVAFARNREYVDSETPLQDNDEVAFIPPVSGGSGPDV
jgi:molybdopterin converting factor subunit 1